MEITFALINITNACWKEPRPLHEAFPPICQWHLRVSSAEKYPERLEIKARNFSNKWMRQILNENCFESCNYPVGVFAGLGLKPLLVTFVTCTFLSESLWHCLLPLKDTSMFNAISYFLHVYTFRVSVQEILMKTKYHHACTIENSKFAICRLGMNC